MTRNRIVGFVGFVWGAGIVISRLSGGALPDPAQAAGQNAALVLGTLMAVAGLYYVVKG